MLAQDAQVLGDGRLADPELLLHDLADLARAELPVVGEELEDPSPHRVAEDVERVHAPMLHPHSHISHPLCNKGVDGDPTRPVDRPQVPGKRYGTSNNSALCPLRPAPGQSIDLRYQ